MNRCWVAALALLPLVAVASPWVFEQPLEVSTANGPGIFHHLGSSGRFGIASSNDVVGVAWEDNRDGVPRCYLALLDPEQGGFVEHRVSGDDPAFEPVVTGLGDGRIAIAWEESGGVWVRVLNGRELGPATRLDQAVGAHAALAWQPGSGLVATWARKSEGAYRIWMALLDASRGGAVAPRVIERRAVDAGSLEGEQTYPSVVATANGRLAIAWEDRRHGHTVIMAAQQDESRQFSPPVQINESFWGGRKLGLGRGTGAMRVSLAGLEGGQVIAVWADKRDFRSGYDVYGAFSTGGGEGFGDNEKIQDEFADGVAQWHPSVASGEAPGLLAVAWDDDRDGTSDVWLSWRDGMGWSADLDVPGASGEGFQVEPAITLDQRGGLHLAWVEKAAPDSPSRIRYLHAPRGQ